MKDLIEMIKEKVWFEDCIELNIRAIKIWILMTAILPIMIQ